MRLEKTFLGDPLFLVIASLVLAGCIFIVLVLVIWLISRMRKMRRELERIRNDLTYTNPGPAPKDATTPRQKNEYTPNPRIKTPEPKRQSVQRSDSSESVVYVPSRQPSLRCDDLGHAQLSVFRATGGQSEAVTEHESKRDMQLEMEEMYENQISIQLHMDHDETSEPVASSRQQSRDEHAFANEGFGIGVITEPIYLNRGELAAVHNPQLGQITDSSQVLQNESAG